MTQRFRGKYRIQSTRAQWWDYANNAAYFITICTQDCRHFFGTIFDAKMGLNEIGKIVDREWKRTFDIRPDMNLWMGEFVVMPNHFHAIIGIGKNKYNTKPPIETQCIASLKPQQPTKNKFGPQSKNLASIIRGFKSAITIHARKINPQFSWQSRFHDHIIRDQKSLENISRYIFNNPAVWQRHRKNENG